MKKIDFLDKFKKNNEEPKIQKMKKSHIPFRLNLVFFVIFALFVSLIVRLGYLQIAEGQQFQERIREANDRLSIQSAAPRGQIYDANGTVLVGNKSNLAVTYTRGKKVSAEDMLEIANKVNSLIDVPADDLTERDKKDYWLANPENLKTAQKRVKDKDREDKKGNRITDEGQLYAITAGKVKPEEINFDEATLRAATIFKRMNSVQEMNTAFIKNDGVTENEVAVIGEHISEMPGISTGMDWSRDYPDTDSLRSILGTVSSEKAGLPADNVEEYLAKGYARNDRVGTSYLEKQYEDILQGTKSKSELVLDSDGKIVSQTLVKDGKKGSNLKLTLDLNFQNQVSDVVKAQYDQLLASGDAPYSDGVYVVVMHPKTGEVMAMVAYDRNVATGEVIPNPLSTINKAFEPGSVVKGATISAGYEAGVISGNDTLIDEPIQINGSRLKSSIYNNYTQMPLTTEQALEYSSNSYMMKLVLKMLDTDYSYNMTLPYSPKDPRVFNELRSTFGEYGMGVSTGIDLPGESTGIVNTAFDNPTYAPNGGNLLDLSFGQYDTYTAMQLAQYVSTVANGGTRVAPRVVKGIYGNNEDGTLGKAEKEFDPKVMNQVNISPEQMQIIQSGFYQVVHGTGAFTTARYLSDALIDTAAKTGTAETFYRDEATGRDFETVNSNIVAYAPAADPEIAVSVIMPHLNSERAKTSQAITKAIINAYAESKQKP
ncbi:peptidoglycan D,D-transpeptidase FtsI family protein [Enterococcus rivorum]|uniref:Cell division protein FtsI n=1 Tax=Enterococcus rivorum TaxID=762845 RepID=A0A1E5KSH1_9ENTE|nr:penicillin-binding protein 2 [Enterococcus rivorum]MBP2098257.1 penicillin-binding protein 2B [Enterococcus rivorum]OEH80824.1 cell division protein FtsI [Enterococcus rivorum]